LSGAVGAVTFGSDHRAGMFVVWGSASAVQTPGAEAALPVAYEGRNNPKGNLEAISQNDQRAAKCCHYPNGHADPGLVG